MNRWIVNVKGNNYNIYSDSNSSLTFQTCEIGTMMLTCVISHTGMVQISVVLYQKNWFPQHYTTNCHQCTGELQYSFRVTNNVLSVGKVWLSLRIKKCVFVVVWVWIGVNVWTRCNSCKSLYKCCFKLDRREPLPVARCRQNGVMAPACTGALGSSNTPCASLNQNMPEMQ